MIIEKIAFITYPIVFLGVSWNMFLIMRSRIDRFEDHVDRHSDHITEHLCSIQRDINKMKGDKNENENQTGQD